MSNLKTYLFTLGIGLALAVSMGSAQATCSGTTTVTCTGGAGAAIHINGAGPDGTTTAATTYPASLVVSGASSGSVATVSITLNGLDATTVNGASSRSMGLLLKSPTGRNLEIMRSVGRGTIDVTNATITIQDGGPAMVSPCSNTTGLVTGTYEPSDYNCSESAVAEPDYTVSSGPTRLHSAQTNGTSTLTNVFAGDTPNGTWSLYLVDDAAKADVSFTSWSITLTVTAASTASTTTLTPNPTTAYTSGSSSSVVLTAAVTAGATGTVTFKDGNTTLTCSQGAQPRTISSNQAVCTTTFSTEGVHVLDAIYSGDGTFVTSSGTANVYIQNHATDNSNGLYCNAGAINNNGRSDQFFSNTTPYPSVIFVGDGVNHDIANTVNTVSVQLKNFSANGTNAMHLLLVAPDGTHAYDFWSNVGSSASPAGDYILIDGASQLPNSTITPGTYSPTDDGVQPDPFTPGPPLPAPQLPASFSYATPEGGGSSKTFQTAFVGANAHGAWSLYLYNGSGATAITSAAGGWCLNISAATGFPVTVTETSTASSGAALGANVTFTATVASPGHPTPNVGSVTFSENGSPVAGTGSGVSTVVAGVASISTTALPEGDHIITASYHDSTGTYNDNFGTVTVRVDQATATPTLVGSAWIYCNTAGITIPQGVLFNNDTGPGTPNPSNVQVSKLFGTISSVTLTMKGFSVFRPADLESLIIGPNGASAPTVNQTLDFFSQTGGTNFYGPADTTFTDASPTLSLAGPPLASNGPTSRNGAGETTYFSSPFYTLPSTLQHATPKGAFTFNTGAYTAGTGGGVFLNTIPNGTWSLYFNQLTHSTGSGATAWCANFIENPVNVNAVKGHTGRQPNGHFQQGQQTGASFSFLITNNGDSHGLGSTGDPDGAHPLDVVDTLDAGLTPVSLPTGSPWDCTSVSQTVTCKSHASIPSGSSYPVLVIPVTVGNNAAATANNQGSLSGGGITAVNSNIDTVTIDPAPILAISKSHTGTFTQGQTATWTLQVSNTSGTAAGNTNGTVVTVVDTLPAGYSLSSSTGTGWTCVGTTTVTCTTNQVVNGAGGFFNLLSLIVNVPANSPTSVTNNAKAFGGGDVVHVDAGTAATTFETISVAQVPASVGINGSGTQSAAINTAFGSLAVTVKDAGGAVIPNYSSVVFTAPASGPSGTFSTTTNTKTLPTDGSGIADPGTFTANAIPGSYSVDVLAGTIHATFNLTNTAPDLTIAKSHIGTFTQGQNGAQYSLVVSNGGTLATSGTITVSDTLPSGLTFASGTGTGWVCAAVLQVVTCTDAATPIAASGSSTITINVNVSLSATGTLNNSATVACTCTESNSGNNTSNTDQVTIVQLSDLTIAKNHVGSFIQSQSAQYSLVVSNGGGGPSSGTITVTDTLPSGLTFVSGTGTGWSCSAIVQAVTCTDAATPIAGSGTSTITLNVTVGASATGTLNNNATVACSCTETNTNNNTSNTDQVTIGTSPDLTIAKSHVGSFVQSGAAQYSLVVTNGGGTATSGTITVTDTLPSGLTFVSGSGTGWLCSASGQAVTCTDAATPIAGSGTSTITLNVTVGASATGTLSNTAVVACTCTEGSTSNNTSNTDQVTIGTSPDLTIAKSHVGSFVQSGAAQYSLVVTNGGGTATSGTITVTDTLPSGLTFVSGSGTGWVCNASLQLVTCTDSGTPITSSGSSTITLNVTVGASTTGTLSNTATVACTCTEGSTSNNTSNTDQVTIGASGNALTINVSPSGGGTFTPTSGTNFPAGPVNITATPNAGYQFVNWTGGTFGNANSASTTVTMPNAPLAITANFQPQATSLGGSIGVKSGPQNARVWPVVIGNNGPGVALNAQVTSFTLQQTSGAACSPTVTSSMPVIAGNLAPGGTGTASVTINFTGCAATAFFKVTANLSANSGAATGSVVKLNQLQ
jgi:uncharacterized repeat protein (TIGR01451 family)/uncharacterized repeat protein (TIGR02543 family)